jgi:hypothetical protein
VDLEAAQVLTPELGRGERLLWSGRPAQGVIFRAGDVFMIPFSLLWGGFAFFWEYSVVKQGAPLLFTLWGIPFVLVGLYIIAGRFFVDSYFRSRTYYGTTDQRVLISSGGRSRNIKSLDLRGLNDISLQERSDRSGTITLGASNPMYAMWSGASWPGIGRKLAPSFERIGDARAVYDLIREAKQKASLLRET